MTSRKGEVWEATIQGETHVVLLIVGDPASGEHGFLGLDLLSGKVEEWPPSLLEEWENKDSDTVMRRIA